MANASLSDCPSPKISTDFSVQAGVRTGTTLFHSESAAAVCSLASVTLGWLKGSIFKAAPMSAVTHSQKIKCAPNEPSTTRSAPVPANATVNDPPTRARATSSVAIGKRPVASLPVDSAINCSIQSERPGTAERESVKAMYCSA